MSKTRLEAFSDGVLAIVITFMVLAFVNPWISMASFVAVAILWVVPDRRIEKNLPHA